MFDDVMGRAPRASNRLQPLADYLVRKIAVQGLPGVRGGSSAELRIPGLARQKDWDVAYEFVQKPRLLISLKSIWKNAGGTVPNRLDDLMGEAANAQQMSPEIVIGYVMLFDAACDGPRQHDTRTWSGYMEDALKTISIRKAPVWNQGLIEGHWVVRFDSRLPLGRRVIAPADTDAAGDAFVLSLLAELRLREPAIPFEAAAPPEPARANR